MVEIGSVLTERENTMADRYNVVNREWAIMWLNAIKEKYIHGGDEQLDYCRRQAIDIAVEVLTEPPIVRCKDCKHGIINANDDAILCEKIGRYHGMDWFCADGEREDGENR